MKIQESAENYLETVLILSERNGSVRSIDIVNELGVTKPSVNITLTDKGAQIANTMYERHTLLSDWLIRLGVTPKTAVEDACRIEHVISAESFQAIKQHTEQKK